MIYPHHPLLDNRPLIQPLRDKVRRRPNQLDAPIISLMIRLRALEARQERMVDIDDASGHGLGQRWA